MVTLSVVVPVFAVERYLIQCLDSIRAGLTAAENASVEIIAVDDASPDRCGAMLDAYAGIRVIHLPHNVGLGLARNAGLASASGDYVWFVDSDDWLPAGSVSAVLAALSSEKPDVLLVDHLRAHEDGRLEVDASSHLLAGPATTDRMLGVQHTAWNRIVSRDFLRRNDLRFGPGWYEDVPFSHPVVLAADHLAALDRVCYHYRIARPGAITSTRSDRHFEAFEQYDNLQQWMGTREVDPALKIKLFSLMISHLLVVVGNEGRMHPSRRRPFFRRLAALYRRHRPAGYTPPSGLKGLKHRLVAMNSYPLYALFRSAYRVTRETQRTPLVSPEVAHSPRQPQAASIL
jgi:glycosyltransferase involved in cell wall biosynthesis